MKDSTGRKSRLFIKTLFPRIVRVVFLLVCIYCMANSVDAQTPIRKAQLLDEAWKFHFGEVADGSALQCDDGLWQTVNVPHDWAIDKPFDMNQDMQWVQVKEDFDKSVKLRTGRTGALPMFGIGWYRKEINVPSADQGKRFLIEFDGAMSEAKVYCNGTYVGEWPYGYSSFQFDLTNLIKCGEKNRIAVRLENRTESSRWYSGAGIYRNVRFVTTDQVHVAHWGTYVTTPVVDTKKGIVTIKTNIQTHSQQPVKVKLLTEIVNPEGSVVSKEVSTSQISAEGTFSQNITITKPAIWSLENPNRYKVVSNIFVGDRQTDRYVTSFGFRTLLFDGQKGFFLNGKHVKLQGVCNHHDLGPIGAAVNYRATERQVQMLKEMGCNSIRTSHNPPSPELLQICDSLGMVVMVESFDEWRSGKNANGYHRFFDQWAEKDMVAMIHRDRNHPSVIMWSIGNEIHEQGSPKGKEIAKFLVDICHREDPTRPTTAGLNSADAAMKFGMTDVIDLAGFNYKPYLYAKAKSEHPNYKIFGSETASTVSSRGVYKFPVKEYRGAWYDDYQVSSYDMEYPQWATTPDTEFEAQDNNEFVMGEYVWTGFDYLGEPTPYNEGTPSKSSYFGIIDLAGIPKDRFFLYQSKWSATPVLHLLPHWNWNGWEGDTIPVYCYSNFPKVELFVNGKSMGIKSKTKSGRYERYRLMWNNVVYQPGEIKAVAYNDKGEIARTEVIKTAGAGFSIRLTADRPVIKADGKDLCYVTAEVLDKDGNFCPTAQRLLFFKATGVGSLRALCNGDATDQTSFASNYMKLFNGKLVAVVAAGKVSGDIKLSVSGERLKPAVLTITTK